MPQCGVIPSVGTEYINMYLFYTSTIHLLYWLKIQICNWLNPWLRYRDIKHSFHFKQDESSRLQIQKFWFVFTFIKLNTNSPYFAQVTVKLIVRSFHSPGPNSSMWSWQMSVRQLEKVLHCQWISGNKPKIRDLAIKMPKTAHRIYCIVREKSSAQEASQNKNTQTPAHKV